MPTIINGTDNSAATPALVGTDTDTGVFFPAANTMAFSTSGTEQMRITSTGDVGIGTSSPFGDLSISRPDAAEVVIQATNAGGRQYLIQTGDTSSGLNGALRFYDNTAPAERMRIDSSGNLLIGKATTDFGTAGSALLATGSIDVVRSAATPLFVNRLADDGVLIGLYQAGVVEGTISVSGTTVSYNGGHLARWSQLPDNSKDDTILKGTVLTNLDDMCVWTKDGEQLPNEQLNKMKVSDVEGDTNVAGVFVNWTRDEDCNSDDMNIAMTGDMIIRIADGVVVQKGDLLMSAGDGTAKPQGDDIVRSKTVAKVTSNYVTCTYADGSYCVPCVLMAC
jgi:hypothetical protein